MADWLRRFGDFARRKERDAVTATLSPFVTEFESAGDSDICIGNAWTRRFYDGPFRLSPPPDRERPAAGLVFVQSRDGNTVARDPSALGGGAADKHLIYEGLSRVAADGVLAGAETVRGGAMVFSTWHPELVHLRAELGLPRHPIQIVATRRGLPVDELLLCNVPDIEAIIVTVQDGAARMERDIASRPWLKLLVMPDPVDWWSAFIELRRLGIRLISAVGGRTLARALVDAALIQDLYLTTSPEAAGEANTPLFDEPTGARLVARKHGTGPESGVRFERYRF